MLRTCLYFQLQTKRQELYSVLIIKLRTFVRIAETLQVLWDASNHLNKSVSIDYGIGLYVTRIVLYFEESGSLHGSINWKNQLRVVILISTAANPKFSLPYIGYMHAPVGKAARRLRAYIMAQMGG